MATKKMAKLAAAAVHQPLFRAFLAISLDATYDWAVAHGYLDTSGGKTIVLTRRPLKNPPPDVEASPATCANWRLDSVRTSRKPAGTSG